MPVTHKSIIQVTSALPYTPPLDVWSANNTLAYSLRKLKTSYNGPCVELQLTSGSRKVIGFTANGLVDRATADAFDDGTARIRTWSHQNGGPDLVQTTYSKMMKWVSSGLNGLPCIRNYTDPQTAIGGMFAADSAAYKTATVQTFAVMRFGLAQSGTQNWYFFGYPSTSSSHISGSAWEFSCPGVDDRIQFSTNSNQFMNIEGYDAEHRNSLCLYNLKTSSGDIRINGAFWGSMGAQGNVSYPNAVGFYIGMGSDETNKACADYFELLTYGSDQANATSIETNMMSYARVIEPAAVYNNSDGSIWSPIYGGNYGGSGGPNGGAGPNGQRLETVNSKTYYTEAPWRSYSIAKAVNGTNATTAYRTEVRQYDRDNLNGNERAELDGSATTPYVTGKTVQFYFKFLLETIDITPQSWLYIFQSHFRNLGGDTSAAVTCGLGINGSNGLHLDICPNETGQSLNDLSTTISANTWYDVFIEQFLSASANSTDTLKMWLNGSQVFTRGPANIFTNTDGLRSPVYPKFGIYSGVIIVPTRAVRHAAMQHSDKAVSDISSLIASPPSNPSWP